MISTDSIRGMATFKKFILVSALGIPFAAGGLFILGFPVQSSQPHAEPHFILGQVILIGFWIWNTLVVAFWVNRLKAPFVARWAGLWVALSYYFLLFIYAFSALELSSWGSYANYRLLLVFLPDLTHLAGTLGFSRGLIVSVLAGPLLLLGLLFQWQAPGLAGALQAAEVFFRRHGGFRKAFLPCSLGAWLALVLCLTTDLPNRIKLGNFRHDPIVHFFGENTSFFHPSEERTLWIQKDQQAEKNFRRRIPKTHNVILFISDALRADHLNCYGYGRETSPFLLSLSRKPGTRRIDWALGNGSESWAGILSVLTSKEPRDISCSNMTLPDYFADNGFQTYLILSGNHRWYDFNHAYEHRKGVFVDGSTNPGPDGVDDDRLILRQLDRLGPDDGGYHFFYFHLMSTHEVGFLQNRYRRYKPTRDFAGVLSEKERNQPGMGQAFVNLYDDDILQADDLIRQILEKLGQKGYLRDYRAVVTGDHGQLFGEHGYFGHGKYAYLNTLRVPLLFFGSEPLPVFPDTRFAVHLDIAPTLADLAGLEIPGTWQGFSLLRPRLREWTYHFSPQDGKGNEGAVVHYAHGRILKYSRTLLKQEAAGEHEAVYDVERDPEEKNNLIGTLNPSLAGEMCSRADQHFVRE